MNQHGDPFTTLEPPTLPGDDSFAALQHRPATMAPAAAINLAAPAVGRLKGFDLLERPLVHGLAACPGEVLASRSTVALKQAMLGREVLVVFEGGDAQRPIIIGVMEPHALAHLPAQATPQAQVTADGQRHVIEAEREIVLRCGEASITLTRAGKVIIRGNYILSRSTGYNKIKGAAIDIN